MKYYYSVSSNNLWASFDYGEVEANSYEEARELAIKQLKYDFQKANDAFNHCDITQGFSIDFDDSQLLVSISPIT